MFVNKYKINSDLLSGNTEYSINVPVATNPDLLGQQEIVDTEFVQKEVDKAVNIIFDYEKVKLLPRNGTNISKSITYRINLLSGNVFNQVNWGDIGFTYDDFKLKKNSLTKSFLRLDFYDSDVATNQQLISFVTLFPKFDQLAQPNNVQVEFVLGNPLINRRLNGEGFALYHFKDEVLPNPLPPKYLYMRATFNNAKDGSSTGFMSSNSTSLSIDDLMRTTKDTVNPVLVNNLYTRYVLTRDTEGYYYEIDTNYSNNVTTPNNDTYIVDLYQITTT